MTARESVTGGYGYNKAIGGQRNGGDTINERHVSVLRRGPADRTIRARPAPCRRPTPSSAPLPLTTNDPNVWPCSGADPLSPHQRIGQHGLSRWPRRNDDVDLHAERSELADHRRRVPPDEQPRLPDKFESTVYRTIELLAKRRGHRIAPRRLASRTPRPYNEMDLYRTAQGEKRMAVSNNGTTPPRRSMLKSKIHRATVTHADIDYEGSLTLDADLLQGGRYPAVRGSPRLERDCAARGCAPTPSKARPAPASCASTAPPHTCAPRRSRHRGDVHTDRGEPGARLSSTRCSGRRTESGASAKCERSGRTATALTEQRG